MVSQQYLYCARFYTYKKEDKIQLLEIYTRGMIALFKGDLVGYLRKCPSFL